MRTYAVPVMAALLSLAGGHAAATQGTPANPPVNVDTRAAVNACLSPAEQRQPLAQINAAQRRRIVACIFASTARQINAQLPVQMDSLTRLDRITVAGTLLTYHYTVGMRRADLPGNVGEIIEGTTRASVCGQANMVQTLQMGGVYSYRWVDNQGVLIHQARIDACQ